MVETNRKIELSLDERNNLRKTLEKKLENVPEGKRMKLPKELVEELLFETNISFIDDEVLRNKGVDIDKFKKAKFPVWTGDFLRKLDLSEVSFDNVTWDLLGILLLFEYSGYDVNEFYELYRKNDNYESTDSSVARRRNCRVVFANTNAIIDFSKAYQISSTLGLCISNCDFSNVDLSKSGLEKMNVVRFSNFSGTHLKGIEFDLGFNYFEKCDFTNSGANFVCGINERAQITINNKVDGCFINGSSAVMQIKSFADCVAAIATAELVSAGPTGRGKH